MDTSKVTPQQTTKYKLKYSTMLSTKYPKAFRKETNRNKKAILWNWN